MREMEQVLVRIESRNRQEHEINKQVKR